MLQPDPTTAQAIADAFDTRTRRDVRVNIPANDGAEPVFQLEITTRDDGRLVCSGRDITAEAELAAKHAAALATSQLAREEATAIARERDRVLIALGHDVRTPVNSIMAICSLLLDGELAQEQRIWLERIRASCESLLTMLNGVPVVGRGGPQTEEVDIMPAVSKRDRIADQVEQHLPQPGRISQPISAHEIGYRVKHRAG